MDRRVRINDGEYNFLRHDGMRAHLTNAEGIFGMIRCSPNKCIYVDSQLPVEPDVPSALAIEIVLDFETEGLDVRKHRILSCAVKSPHKNFHWYINQPNPNSSDKAIDCHNIKNDDWRLIYSPHTEADLIREIVSLVPSGFGSAIIVAHNGTFFDFPLFIITADRNGIHIPPNVHFADTCYLSRKIQTGRHNLRDACETAKIAIPSSEDIYKMFTADELEGYDVRRISADRRKTPEQLQMEMKIASSSFHSAIFDVYMCSALFQILWSAKTPTRFI